MATPPAQTAPPPPKGTSLNDVLRVKAAVADGKVPGDFLAAWMRERLAAIHGIVEQYATQSVRITIATAEEGKKIGTVAWTDTDIDGIKNIHLAASDIINYGIEYDPDNQRMKENVTAFSTILSGLVYHEMGHIILTPNNIGMYPDCAYWYSKNMASFNAFVSKLPQDVLVEFYLCWRMLQQYQKAPHIAGESGELLLDAMAVMSERISEIFRPWIEEAIAYKPSIPTATVTSTTRDYMRAAVGTSVASEFASLRAGDTPAVYVGRTPEQRVQYDERMYNAIYQMFISIDPNSGPTHGVTRGNNSLHAPAIGTSDLNSGRHRVEQLLASKKKFQPVWTALDIYLTQARQDAEVVFHEEDRQRSMAEYPLYFKGYDGAKWAKFWHYYFNMMEDQRLETQLASYYGGMGGYFSFLVTRVMQQSTRYQLTAGRLYFSLRQREEDRVAYEAYNRTSIDAVPSAGFLEWMAKIPGEYVTAAEPADTQRMAHLISVYMILHQIFWPSREDLPKSHFDGGHEGHALDAAKPKQKGNVQLKQLAAKAADKKNVMDTIERKVDENPDARARLDLSVAMSQVRKELTRVVALDRMKEDTKKK